MKAALSSVIYTLAFNGLLTGLIFFTFHCHHSLHRQQLNQFIAISGIDFMMRVC